MTTVKLTANELKILTNLRAAYESVLSDENGIEWGTVYLSNAGSGRSFAATLGALKRKGMYRDYNSGDPNHDNYFGKVRLN